MNVSMHLTETEQPTHLCDVCVSILSIYLYREETEHPQQTNEPRKGTREREREREHTQ